jgi:hypothetical protein
MTDQVDSTGVPLDQDELGDPSDNVNSPDPLIDESPKSGALSAIGSKTDQQSRVATGRAAMDQLRAQYTGAAGQASDAYAAQKKTLDNATQRLLSMQYGPSPQEQAYRVAAAAGTGDSAGRFNPAGISSAHADMLAQTREAELAKQQLLTQYGMQIPASQLGAANQRMNQITQQMRIQQSENNNAATKADVQAKPVNKYFMPDPSNPAGPPVFNQALYDTDMQANKDKADINAKAKVWAQQAAVGQIAPEAVNYVEQNQATPPGFSRNPAVVAKLWTMAHDQNVQNGNDVGAAYAHAQANKALTPALAQLSKQQAMVTAYEANAEKSATMALGFSNQVDRTGVPLFNRWVQSGRTNIAGDPTSAQFQAANNTFLSEYSKIMSGSMGNQATTDAAMAHAQQMLSTAMTQKQYNDVIGTLRQEMHNRMDTMEQTRQGLLSQMAGTKPAAPATPTQPLARPGQKPIDPLVASYLPGGANFKAPAP